MTGDDCSITRIYYDIVTVVLLGEAISYYMTNNEMEISKDLCRELCSSYISLYI